MSTKEHKRMKRATDPDFVRRHNLSRFKMTPEEYDRKLFLQSGVCVICSNPPGVRRLHVDHDHSCCPTLQSCGKCIRDLLCVKCNSGTGIADSPELLRKRAAYIEFWREVHTVRELIHER